MYFFKIFIYTCLKKEIYMKKIINSLTFAVVLAACSQIAFADGMPYEPVFESAPISEASQGVSASTASSTAKAAEALTGSVEDTNKLQGALLQLDSAQVDIRNSLVQYKNEYAELDNQYKVIKLQRKAKKQQVKDTEKRIKTLDKTKENIRKSM